VATHFEDLRFELNLNKYALLSALLPALPVARIGKIGCKAKPKVLPCGADIDIIGIYISAIIYYII
jgi:hypothetical protein